MAPPVPTDPSQTALRSMIRRVIVFFVAGMLVIGAFAVAYLLGAFTPAPR